MAASLKLVRAELVDVFAPARERFEALARKLSSPEMMRMSHRKIEEMLFEDGMEMLRQLMQGHIDARGGGGVGPSVEGSDGVERTHQRTGSRGLETRFGRVEVNRVGYSARGVNSLFPLDAELNLPADTYSHSVRRIVAEAAAQGSFDEVTKIVERHTGAHVPKRQAEELTVRFGQDFAAFYERRQHHAQRGRRTSGSILVLTTDAKGVRVHPQDLREPTAKKAAGRQHKMEHRLSPGEKLGAKRMATVASVYTIKPFVRSAVEVMCDLKSLGVEDAVPLRKRRPTPEHKRVWAHIIDDPAQVIEGMYAEANSRDPEHEKNWVVLVDGNNAQLGAIKKAARKYGVKQTIVVDVIHVLEYLWEAAHDFNPGGTEEIEQWVGERLHQILAGKASHVAAGIRRSATLRGLPHAKRARADTCADYLLKYAPHLKYDEYLAAGFPIATGVIEGACRHLVKDRMGITGARWRLKTAEAVLCVRSLRSSGDLEAYARFHELAELKRNHRASYAHDRIPSIPRAAASRRANLKLVKP